MKAKSVINNAIMIIILTLITAGSFGMYIKLVIDEPLIELAYAASEVKEAPIYTMQDNELTQTARIVRGKRLKLYAERKSIKGKTYARLAENVNDESEIYIAEDNICGEKAEAVKESKVYIRTPSTIYADAKGPAIASFAPKGIGLKVTGYDELLEDGSVSKYKVAYGEGDSAGEGYIYSRYTVTTQEEAESAYNGGGVYDKVKDDNYAAELYGGKAANLDYYPRERVSFEDNQFCKDAKAMYINSAALIRPAAYVKIINETDCNAVVIDIKDGYLAYQSELAKELSPTSYKSAYASVEDYRKGVDAYRKTGAYLIGRIVVFNDYLYAKDHPEDCIKYAGERGWPSAFSRKVWEYNVRLALEAARLFGFNEIQFDYVRFPESSYQMSASGKANFRNIYKEEKGQAVQNFCIYAADMLHEAGVYMSVDVFGESAYGYMTAYGQYWAGISNVADAISAMPYTDHMGADDAWKKPYDTVLAWSRKAKKEQDKLESSATARTWITGYDTPHWEPSVNYDAKMLKTQVKALQKAGLTGGFIPWNAASDLTKYREYKAVWNK